MSDDEDNTDAVSAIGYHAYDLAGVQRPTAVKQVKRKDPEAAAAGAPSLKAPPPSTPAEAAAVYLPDAALVSAINDAKVLAAAYFTSAHVASMDNVWYLTSGRELGPCQLYLVGKTKGVPFRFTIVADRNGAWRAKNSQQPARPSATYADLHTLLKREAVGAVAAAGGYAQLPKAVSYEWIAGVDGAGVKDSVTPDLQSQNLALYGGLLAKEGGSGGSGGVKPFHVLPTPCPQPHMVLASLRTPAADYVLAYHNASGTWFLTTAFGSWARCSFDLSMLLATLLAPV